MKILALDTSTEACSAALYQDGQFECCYQLAPQQHSQLILTMLEQVLAAAECSLSQLDAIAFGRGPGSFTGLRIAAGVTQGIALAHDLPVVAVSCLRALAQQGYRCHQAKQLWVLMDARMQAVYTGFYHYDAEVGMRLVADEQVCGLAQLQKPLASSWQGIGQGWLNCPSELAHGHIVHACYYPHAQDIATLAALDFAAGKVVAAEAALPIYLRDQVAVKSC